MPDGIADPLRRMALTAGVARAIREGGTADLGRLRAASGLGPALRAVEEEFESLRDAMREARAHALVASGIARAGLSVTEARRVRQIHSGRDLYRGKRSLGRTLSLERDVFWLDRWRFPSVRLCGSRF
jgi:hypothetical protein